MDATATGTAPRRRRDAVANRQRLLQTAGRLFAAGGLEVPLEEIATGAGVSIGTLYNHFASRAELVEAIYPERVAALAQDGRAALLDADPWSGFAGFLTAIFARQAADRGLNDAMTQRLPATPALTAACERGTADLGAIVERAQRAGVVRADLTGADLACLVWSVSRIISATASVAADAWRRQLDLQLDGLRAGNAHPLTVAAMTPEQVAAAMRA